MINFLNRKLSSRKTRASHSEFFAIKVNFRSQSSAWLSWCLFDLTFWDVSVFSCSLSPWPCSAWTSPPSWGSHWSCLCPPRGGSPGFSSAGSGSPSQSGPSSAARETQQTCWGCSVSPLHLLLLHLPTSTKVGHHYDRNTSLSSFSPLTDSSCLSSPEFDHSEWESGPAYWVHWVHWLKWVHPPRNCWCWCWAQAPA